MIKYKLLLASLAATVALSCLTPNVLAANVDEGYLQITNNTPAQTDSKNNTYFALACNGDTPGLGVAGPKSSAQIFFDNFFLAPTNNVCDIYSGTLDPQNYSFQPSANIGSITLRVTSNQSGTIIQTSTASNKYKLSFSPGQNISTSKIYININE